MPLDTCRSLKYRCSQSNDIFCIPKGPASTPEIPLLQIPRSSFPYPIILPLPAERTHDPPHLTHPAGFSPSPIILTPTRRANPRPTAPDTPRGLSPSPIILPLPTEQTTNPPHLTLPAGFPLPDHPHPYPPNEPPARRIFTKPFFLLSAAHMGKANRRLSTRTMTDREKNVACGRMRGRKVGKKGNGRSR